MWPLHDVSVQVFFQNDESPLVSQWIPDGTTGKYLEFMAPPTQPMGLHEESGKYGRDVDVRAVAQYVGNL